MIYMGLYKSDKCFIVVLDCFPDLPFVTLEASGKALRPVKLINYNTYSIITYFSINLIKQTKTQIIRLKG